MSEQLTAYEQSIQIGMDLMKTANKIGMDLMKTAAAEQTELGRLQQAKAAHRKAFRVAFDLLEKLWPPENTVEYWTMAAGMFAVSYNDAKDNLLAKELLPAVYGYLEKSAKGNENAPPE